jgi:TetR/AcrR family transcriptional regulator, regulator of autoinduction and epiphytic fitness
VLTAEDPLEALWQINTDSRLSGLYTEFMALANHRKVIGVELKAFAERVRDIETAAVTLVLRANGVDLQEFPPVAMSMLLTQTARSLCNEDALCVTQGHDELREFVERIISRFRADQTISS